jgi:hypothetical protein
MARAVVVPVVQGVLENVEIAAARDLVEEISWRVMLGVIAGSITCRADSMTSGRLPDRNKAKLFRVV